ncbi:Protein TIC 62, chloroplastic [Glycine soja]
MWRHPSTYAYGGFLRTVTIPSNLSRREATEKPSVSHVNLSHFTRYPGTSRATKLKIPATMNAACSAKTITATAEGISEKTDSKDDNLVFVACATGRVGSRTVRELIKLGFRVRAGVQNAQRAGALVQSVEQLKLDGASGGGASPAVEKLEILKCDLEKPDTIGYASKVICSIVASEKGGFDITAPFQFPKDYQVTKNLIEAATVAKVNHFIMVTSLGTNKIGFLLFWGFLIWKRKEEEALLASGLPYAIVRTGCMEQPTDAFKETHNITLSREDTLFRGQVSNLQIAELMAVRAKNRDLSYCKIVEVIAETNAPLSPMEELLAKIPSQRPYISSPKEPDIAAVSVPDPSANVVAAEPSVATQKETAQPKPVANQPLSPYTVYDDLKATIISSISAWWWETNKDQYPDLKPPTSPSPNAPTISVSTSAEEGVPEIATVSSNGPAPAQLSIADEPKEEHLPEPKSRPLSPYTIPLLSLKNIILLPLPMEAFSVQSLTATTIPSSLSRRGATDKPSATSHVNISHFMRYPCTTRSTKQKILCTRAQASGSTKSSTGSAEGISEKTDSKDDNLVFVAGATGRVGSRTVRELIKLGFRVRAGVRSAQRAGALVQSVEQLKLDGASGGGQAVEKLEIVECDLEKPETIGSALGDASTVICSIGASEKEVFDITGPFRIDYQATKNLIDAATVAKVNHFILVTSLGTNKIGFPAAILNLFWGVLVWKRKAEEALLASGLPYTIVRPGGMERPTDAFKETHNITLSTEDTLFGGLVSNLQIAELLAVMAKNRDLSYCKIVEAIAETTAPLTPMEELLAKIPSQRPYISSPKKPDIAAVSVPDPPANVVTVEPKVATQQETAQPKPVAKQPLSPYIVYDDLKPPSSPSPSQPGGGKPTKISETVPKPSASDTPSSVPGVDGISQTTSSSKVEKPLSPYVAYPDLKPPTSPSPNAPTVSVSTPAAAGVPEIDTISSNGPAQLSAADEPKEEHLPEPKSRPLSPYTMVLDCNLKRNYGRFGNTFNCFGLPQSFLLGRKVLEGGAIRVVLGLFLFSPLDSTPSGTMDVLFVDSGNPWNPKPETISKVMATLKGVHGVLKAGGTFISPHFRRPIFNAPDFSWSVEWTTFGETFHYFVYVLKKGQRSSHDDIPPVKRFEARLLIYFMKIVPQWV